MQVILIKFISLPFKNINELAPGHYLKFSPGKEISVNRYWSLPHNKNLITEEKLIPEFTEPIFNNSNI